MRDPVCRAVHGRELGRVAVAAHGVCASGAGAETRTDLPLERFGGERRHSGPKTQPVAARVARRIFQARRRAALRLATGIGPPDPRDSAPYYAFGYLGK